MKKVIVIGTGGHAKVVIDILNAMSDVTVVGVTSKELQQGAVFCGYNVLGDDSVLTGLKEQDQFDQLAMGVGGYRDNNIRRKIFENLKAAGFNFINVVHPHAYISPTTILAEGCVIFPGVLLNTESKIGNNSIIATGASIDHETVVGDHALVSAGATVGANVTIKDGALIALSANVISGITIGANTLIGSGTVVIRDTEDNATYVGNPAKRIK